MDFQNDKDSESLVKRGRGQPPKLTPDEKTLQHITNLSRLQPTMAEAASVVIPGGVNRDTFSDFLRKYPEAQRAWELGREMGKLSLRRFQYLAAEKGNVTMLVWLGKQWLGQKDLDRLPHNPQDDETPTPADGTALEDGTGMSALMRATLKEASKKLKEGS